MSSPPQSHATSPERPAEDILALTDLRPGEHGRLHAALLDDADRQLLAALGLVNRSSFRLCKSGDPWIVQVRGTRIGLADDVARRLQVIPAAD